MQELIGIFNHWTELMMKFDIKENISLRGIFPSLGEIFRCVNFFAFQVANLSRKIQITSYQPRRRKLKEIGTLFIFFFIYYTKLHINMYSSITYSSDIAG